MINGPVYNLRLMRTLYNNLFRAHVLNENNDTIGILRISPCIPLDRSEVPADAPEAHPYLIVVVEDADINKDNLIDFEERVSLAVLKKFTTETSSFHHCEFYYPSPAFVIQQEDAFENGEDAPEA